MTSAFFWQNSVSLCPASFCTPRPNLPVTLSVSWLPTFAFQSPIMKRTSFVGVSSKRMALEWHLSCTGAAAAWCWGDFEEIPHVYGQRRSPIMMVGGVKLRLESNPISSRDAQRAQKPCVHQDPQTHRDSDRTVWVSPVEVHAGDQPRLIQGIRRRDGIGEDQDTIASIRY